MIKKIAIGLGVVVLALLAAILTRPPTFEVTRSIVIAAPPEAAFALVDDFHQWNAWSPWDKLDPSQARTFTGPSTGTGAVYHWKGNKQVGEGEMRIVDSKPGEHVSIDLSFIEPFPSKSLTTFDFVKTSVEDERREHLHGQGDEPGHQHGLDDRP
jgi:uncharacterized protein YndB with AHSA1/START domain